MKYIRENHKKIIDNLPVLSSRIEHLRRYFFDSKVHICAKRSHLATLSWKETEGQHLHIRRARLFEKICDYIPIAIFDHELIVGSQTEYVRGVGLQLDFSPRVGLEVEKGDRRLRSDQSHGVIDEEDLNTIIEDRCYWDGRSPGDVILSRIRESLGTLFEDISYDSSTKSYGTMSFFVPDADYAKVLRVGLKGIIDEIENELEGLEFTSPEDGKRYHFLRAAKISCNGLIKLARRYSDLAMKLAAEETDMPRKKELESIASICRRVPEHPPDSFYEALQSARFIHLGLYLEDGNGSGASLERVDQYLYPFYKSDIEKGALTHDMAAELFAAFWVKVATTEAIPPAITKISGSGYLHTRAILGGIDREGKDACNEMTYLVLHIAGEMKMGVPIYLRWHSGIDRDLMRKAVWVNMQIGSEPAFHNDEQVIPGLIADGASLEDARDYSVVGCCNPFPYGSTYGTFHFMNGGKVLELVMYRGYDPRTGKMIGKDTGDPKNFININDWIDAYLDQWEYMYDIILRGCNIGELAQMDLYSQPFASALTPDCIKRGKDVHEGGMRYPQFTGDIYNKIYADVPDSLLAINEFVYKQKKITVDEIVKACEINFEGPEGDRIRRLLDSGPKYGNDTGEPERIYRILNDRAGAIGRSRSGYFGYPKRDTKIGGALHSSHGRVVGALPNGRKSGLPLADGGISPCAGCDIKGPTITFRSVANALDFQKNRSAVLNQKMPKSYLKTMEQIDRFVDLNETYLRDLNGYQVQWNIEDADIYRAAQSNPSAYRNLLVRVGGYSAYFIELDSLLQDQIIARTEQSI